VTRHVVVVGGGISGLATAYWLTRSGTGTDRGTPLVTVLESGPELGGAIRTVEFTGRRVDTGPEALLVRTPVVNRLLAELGLDEARRAPEQSGAFIWARGALRPIPRSSVFGVPSALLPLLRSGLIGPLGLARATADLVLPRSRRLPADPTIEQLLRPRFGRQVFTRMIEPLLGGVYAGQASLLSARSAVPEVTAALAGRRSVYLALRGAPPRTGGGPALISFEGGLGRLVAALANALREVGDVDLRTRVAVTGLRVGPDGRHQVRTATGESLTADDVVLAVPAWSAARLLGGVSPAAADAAGQVPHASVAVVLLAYEPSAFPEPLRGTGFLVPPADHRLLVGCTWLTAKWPHLTTGGAAEPVLIRCMVGRDGDQRWTGLDDAALVAAVRAELSASMGLDAEPEQWQVRRLSKAMPQYTVGHADRLAALDAALAEVPGLWVTGSGYRGVGLASCIGAAETLAGQLRSRPGSGAGAGEARSTGPIEVTA